ncbi:MAG: PPC domain-containing protein, partial [Pirellulales bacterium]
HNVYTFTTTKDGRMTVAAQGRTGDLDTMITIYDSQGREVYSNDDWRGTDSRVTFDVQAGEQYFVDVTGYGDTSGNYKLGLNNQTVRANSQSPSQNPARALNPRPTNPGGGFAGSDPFFVFFFPLLRAEP